MASLNFFVCCVYALQDPDIGVNRICLARQSQFQKKKWFSEVCVDASATPDPYCVVTVVPQPGYEAQPSIKTDVVDDDLTPEWNKIVRFDVFSSTAVLRIQVFNANGLNDREMGYADIAMGYDGIPGPALTGDCLSREVELSQSPVELTVKLKYRSSAKLTRSTSVGQHSTFGAEDGDDAGEITLQLAYTEIVPREELEKVKDDSGDLIDAMMIDEQQRISYRFRTVSEERARAWLVSLRWIAMDCPSEGGSQPDLPTAPILASEMRRAEADISLIDLPFCRVSALLRGLYARKCMGSHNPTRRTLLYSVFQLEAHAWHVSAERKRRQRKSNKGGIYLQDLHGLNFHLTLERLCLLHYGKHQCLSYEHQMKEWRDEVQHVALHIIQCMVARWVCRRRTGKTIAGRRWPYFEAWRKYPQAFQLAIDGITATRMRSLQVLLHEVNRFSKPTLFDVELTARDNESQNEVVGGGKRCGCLPAKPSVKEHTAEAAALEVDDAAIDAAFDRVDTDGSGCLSRSELQLAFQLLMTNADADSIEELTKLMMSLMARPDTDSGPDDGCTLTYTKAEFAAGIQKVLAYIMELDQEEEDDADSDIDENELSVEELQQKLLPGAAV
jgi:hypothetical protein